jgi:putative membrane protein
MRPEMFWWGGWWIFPIVMPVIMVLVMLMGLYFVFGQGRLRPAWWDTHRHPHDHEAEPAMEILKKRYARGEITREEFEQMKKDLLS